MRDVSRISVAIATYNRAHIIPETLGHVLGQSFAPAEVIVVDDGSTDGTREAVESVSKDIRYFRQENAGPGAALKKAIELCGCEWIALCDDDDRWRPEHLSRKQLLLSKYPEVDYAFSNFTSFGPDAKPNYNAFSDIPPGWLEGFPNPDEDGFQLLGRDLLGNFLSHNPVFPTSTCFSRGLYEKCGGIDPKFSRLGCWDAHFTWRLVLHGNTACDHHITAETRRHGGSFSRKKSKVYVERSEMIQTAWEDGWIPRRLHPQVLGAIHDSLVEASWWSWYDKDYAALRDISHMAPFGSFPSQLKTRILFSRLIAPLLGK